MPTSRIPGSAPRPGGRAATEGALEELTKRGKILSRTARSGRAAGVEGILAGVTGVAALRWLQVRARIAENRKRRWAVAGFRDGRPLAKPFGQSEGARPGSCSRGIRCHVRGLHVPPLPHLAPRYATPQRSPALRLNPIRRARRTS